MAKTTITGYPRIGPARELKFLTESYFKGDIGEGALKAGACELKKKSWLLQKQAGLDFIPSGDFSFYDGLLDAAVMVGAVPNAYKSSGLSELDTYFAMARGHQGGGVDLKALPMKKWFNTNYHYIVPVFDDDTQIGLGSKKPFEEYKFAHSYGVQTRPVIVGPFTLLKLSDISGKKRAADYAPGLISVYGEVLSALGELGAEWVQLDEPSLVTDLTAEDIALFKTLYDGILGRADRTRVLIQTYFGDVRDAYDALAAVGADGIGLDFAEGKKTLELLTTKGFPADTVLFAGVVNGKNIWRNDYSKTLSLLDTIKSVVAPENIVLTTSCSLLHVPYTLEGETGIDERHKSNFAFAQEKLLEIAELGRLADSPDARSDEAYIRNAQIIKERAQGFDPAVKARTDALTDTDYTRLPAFEERQEIQAKALSLPLLPTTTIGSFPQTGEVKALRAAFKKGEITEARYKDGVKEKIAACVRLQEEIGLDVLVHGEFERNDMVEFFGENLNGFLFTKKAWVQSYGTRCVKPPIIVGDVSRRGSITSEYIEYAQSLTDKPVKGMLTGPVTILNWSFPREDVPCSESALQIALAIREEVLELEERGIRVIQIDEAALKEKLPLRREDWHVDYLDWAIPSFRLTHSGVKPGTQIHTHMCYSEFNDIVKDIENMDADVISFEASRSNLSIVDALKRENFKTQVGPGVYDIHSPRVPSREEICGALRTLISKLGARKLWVNPDCGLKTRGEAETSASLKNLVEAAKEIRAGSL